MSRCKFSILDKEFHYISSSEKKVFRDCAIVEKKKKGGDRKKYFPAKKMNKREISEIKKQFSPDNCCITRICGCYVDGEKNKKTKVNYSVIELPSI